MGSSRVLVLGQWFLLVVGLSQMTGDLLQVQALKGLGAASAISPAPKVFSAVKGLETYSTKFFLEWKDKGKKQHSLALTPEAYSKVKGPYNRRNVYGAAVAYAPVLPPELRDPVMHYALTGKAPLLRELGIDPAEVSGKVQVRLEPMGLAVLPEAMTTFEFKVEAP